MDRRRTSHVVRALVLVAACLMVLVLAAATGAAVGAGPGDGQDPGELAPVNPEFALGSLITTWAPVSPAGRGLGDRPAPHLGYVPPLGGRAAAAADAAYPAAFDLRGTKTTSVKNQGIYGTCWAFASCGSVESWLMPGQDLDFSEDNMVLTAGFDYDPDIPGTVQEKLYDTGGSLWMAAAYLTRWGGPVWESDDAYGDQITPAGLTPRKHVHDVSVFSGRASPTDNDRLKYAVSTFGGTYVSMSWQDGAAYFNETTSAYYYNGTAGTNHGVLVVGWDDAYAKTNFATQPAGDGAFIVKNSWSTGFGDDGYFYVSYHDTRFGPLYYSSGGYWVNKYAAAFTDTQPVTDYDAVYQYDALGSVSDYGTGSSDTYWVANRYTAGATSSLQAVGFYANAPGTGYQVWLGPSTSALALSTSGTLPDMGFHTVPLSAAYPLTEGDAFVVALRLQTPGYEYPAAIEYAAAGYSSGATAATGQSYRSTNGTAWYDLTVDGSPANACIKAFAAATPVGPPAITVTAPTITARWPSGSAQTVAWTADPAVPSGEFRVSLVSAAGTWYVNKQVLPVAGRTAYSTQITAAVPAGTYKAAVYWRPTVGTGLWTGTAKSASFTVTAINVTVPGAGTVWPAASTQYVSWNVNPAMDGGQFLVALVSAGGTWYVNKLVAGTAGRTSYTTAVNTVVPAGAGYRAAVYWRATPGSGAWTVTQKGAAFTIATLAIGAPAASSSWPRLSTQTVEWSVTPGLPGGQFFVWLVSSTGGWYVNKAVTAVAGRTDYDTSIVVDVPAAGVYKAAVYWRPVAGTGAWVLTKKSAGFSVTP
jgi:C1A family cysteine protease